MPLLEAIRSRLREVGMDLLVLSPHLVRPVTPLLVPPAGAAHIGAMYTAFLSVAIACGTPGLLAALALGACARACTRLLCGGEPRMPLHTFRPPPRLFAHTPTALLLLQASSPT